MHPYEFNLSFRVTHQTRDLSDLYQKLTDIPAFIPGRTWKAGDERLTQQGKKLEGHYKESYCYFSVFAAPQKTEVEYPAAVIERIVEQLLPFKSDLQDHIKSGGELEVFVSLYVNSNSAEVFRPELMRKLADFGIQLSIDIYPDDIPKTS